MTTKEKTRSSITRDHMRDNYILAQALVVAIETLQQVEFPEHSNIADMKLMLDTLFPKLGVVIQHNRLLSRAVRLNLIDTARDPGGSLDMSKLVDLLAEHDTKRANVVALKPKDPKK